MSRATDVITNALLTAGIVGEGQAAQTADIALGFNLLNSMISIWQQQRNVAVIPGLLPVFTDLTTSVTFWDAYDSALLWGLVVRLKNAYGLEPSQAETVLAQSAAETLQANNKQFQPSPTAAQNVSTGYGLIYLALRAAGRIDDKQGVAQGSQDVSDALFLLQQMLAEWQQDRAITGTPGTFPTVTDPAATLTLGNGIGNAIIWNLAVRIRSAFGLDDNQIQIDRAAKALAAIQANNKQYQPPVHAGPATTPIQVIFLALRLAGRITDQQSVADNSQDVADAFSLLVAMLAQWQRERWLVFGLKNYSAISNGGSTYMVGPGGDFDILRPTKIESAFARLNYGTAQTLDYQLQIIPSREDYDQIALKNLNTIPSYVFYDAAYPQGNLKIWPVAPANTYEIHITCMASLPVYGSVNDSLDLPPEYVEALIYNLACRLPGGDPSAETQRLATKTRQTLRKANTQIGLLQMPGAVLGRMGAGWTGLGGVLGGIPGQTLIPLTGSDGTILSGSDGQALYTTVN